MGYENMIQPVRNLPDYFWYQKRYHCAIPKRAISKEWIDNYYASAALNKVPSYIFTGGRRGVWYDPADLLTLFQDDAGLIPVTASGQLVGKMLDKSGNGCHATQTDDSKKPVFYMDGQYAWLEFGYRAGNPAVLDVPAGLKITATDQTNIVVGAVSHPKLTAGVLFEVSPDAAANPGTLRLEIASTGAVALYASGTTGTNIVASGPAAYAKNVIYANTEISPSSAILSVNGGTDIIDTSSQGTGALSTLPLTIGNNGAGVSPFIGKLFGFIIVARTFTADQRDDLFDYMNIKTPDTSYLSDDFIMSITTTIPSTVFTIPCTNNGTFDAVINWGDGSESAITAYNDVDLAHTYAAAGDYNISIKGSFPNVAFSNSANTQFVTAVQNLGVTGWVRLANSFQGCSAMRSFSAGRADTSAVTTFANMMRGNTSLVTFDAAKLNTGAVTSMLSMFPNDAKVDYFPIAGWDINQVAVFDGAAAFMSGCRMSPANYDAVLNSWAAQNPVSGLTVTFGASRFTRAGAAARSSLITNNLWTIIDGGPVETSALASLSITAATSASLTLTSNDGAELWVDWGDGTVVSCASGATVSRTYASAFTGNVLVMTATPLSTLTMIESASDGWTFDLSALPTTVTRVVFNGANTAISGDLASIPAVTYLVVWGSNTVSGSLSSISGVTYLSLTGSNTVRGDLASISKATYVAVHGANTITGDLSNIPSATYVAIWGSSYIRGDLSSIPLANYVSIGVSTIVSGNLTSVPLASYISLMGANTATFSGSWTTATMRQVLVRGAALLSTTVTDDLLNALAATATTWTNEKVVNIKGTRTAASDAAVATLQGLGVTVTIG